MISMILTYTRGNQIYSTSFTDKGEANNWYKKLCSDKNVENIEGRYMIVKVRFPGYHREYTYLSDMIYNPGTQLLVNTDDGVKTVTVVTSGLETKKNLEKVIPMYRYKEILGRAS